MKKVLFLICLSSLFVVIIKSQSRPYIIVKESEYDSLRMKADTYPWSAFKENAVKAVEELEYRENTRHIRKTSLATDLAGALSLCYILFPESKPLYISKLENDVLKLIDDIRKDKETTDIPTEHGYNVGPAQAAFLTYIALDIMYYDLDPLKRKEIEDDLEYISLNHHRSWFESKYAIEGMYALYNYGGKSKEFIERKNSYKEYFLDAASEDGVYTTGPGYAHSRLYMKRRVQKKMFMDICEYQGYHEFYSEPVFINLYEWLFGYSMTPFNLTYTFGDSPPVKPFHEWTTSALRVNRFSKVAQAYAAWFIGPMGDFDKENTLLNYLLTDSIPVKARQPKSRIFKNGGAWLLGDDPTQDNITGVLWNIYPNEQSHNHLEVNSIHITAFGDNIIRNSGYDGWGEPNAELWEWVSKDARSSNTLTVGNYNHQSLMGGGIKESVIGYDIVYASGNSGRSLINSIHNRSLLFVKPIDNLPGYFYVFDEASTLYDDKEVNIYFHPNSNSNPKIKKNNQYKFRIKPCTNFIDSLFVTIKFIDKPNHLEIKEGYLASYDECSRFFGKYIDAGFITTAKYVDVATILFPHRNDDKVPVMETDENKYYSLAKLKFDSHVEDYFINPKLKEDIEIGSFLINTTALYVRKFDTNDMNIWCYKGNKFLNKQKSIIGFESDSDITFLLNGQRGEIVTSGSSIRIYYPEVNQIIVDGNRYLSNDSNEWVDVKLGEGNHRYEIISNIKYERRETANDDYYLSNTYPYPANRSTKITYRIPSSQHVKIVLYDSLDNRVETIFDKHVEAGTHSVFLDSSKLSKGVYSYKMITKEKTLSKKMILAQGYN
ncbi:MAG: T9SS type A sorting domain-containing protein [Ignavibacteria bacterium]|jgi:hypothetical protein